MGAETRDPRIAAYVYGGWHPIPERDASFHPGFTEWELVADCRPRFDGHRQPRVPALGTYDDRDPREVEPRLRLLREHGVDATIWGAFWCRGKRVFEESLDRGLLGCDLGRTMPFAVMWANRLPRRVLPVRRADLPVLETSREVPTDVDDFVTMLDRFAYAYFRRDNYLRLDGRVYFSIFDSTFFLRELGEVDGARAIQAGRESLRRTHGLELHLAAVEPNEEDLGRVARVGFDSVTHYVHLPDWKGPTLQDYRERAAVCAEEWSRFAEESRLPYTPSVATGWDASPRGADFGPARPDKYPWSPVITGSHPIEFRHALERALNYARGQDTGDPWVFIASANEWSEGHYLEPDRDFGLGWLEAVRGAKRRSGSGAPRG